MTGRIENTVFISYRRTNLPWALAIYQNLTQHGYDVFFDYESIRSGDFEQTGTAGHIEKVGLMPLHTRLGRGWQIARRSVHFIAAFQQRRQDMPPDKTGCACDENPFHLRPPDGSRLWSVE